MAERSVGRRIEDQHDLTFFLGRQIDGDVFQIIFRDIDDDSLASDADLHLLAIEIRDFETARAVLDSDRALRW